MANQFKIFRQAVRETNQQFLPVLWRCWPWLVGLLFLSQPSREYFNYVAHHNPENLNLRLMAMLGLLSTSATVTLILILVVPIKIEDFIQKKGSTSVLAFAQKHAGPLLIESVRALGWVILWLFAFIIPGIIKQIRYIMVPYVVMFNSRYSRGEVDALEESEALVKGSSWLIFLLLVIATLIDACFDLMNQKYNAFTAPGIMMVLAITKISFSVYTFTLLYALYKIKVALRSK